ncbi:MAG: Gfo/Idh/MocA family oxidoreductase [Bacteroidota bacterium]|nr:Gfo/Idh/MocA family oxidoreductase [Bacteroidota bacterium]
MKSSLNISRRNFLKNAAIASSVFIVPRRVLGGPGYTAPSDKVTLGFIGCGRQSGGLQRRFSNLAETQIVAACDPYAAKLQTFVDANNRIYAELTGQSTYDATQRYVDFRELLARKDIDAVIIASPDHWHAAMSVRAAEAGKDIYCEKPLSLTVKEGRAMVKATRDHGRVFQTGSMQRSTKEFTQAVQLVRSGAIGEIKKVVVSVGGPPKDWDLQGEPMPEGLNWELWMGPNVTDRPYNNVLAPNLDATFWAKWRDYKEFGGGLMTDWGAHMFDIGQWGLGMDNSGPVKVIAPGKDAQAGLIYEYANGVQMIHQPDAGKNYCHFFGTEGDVYVQRGELRTTPVTLKDKVFQPDDYKIYVSDNHYQDFINSMKTRKPPICDVEVGHRTATVCNIGNIAYALGRTLEWDPGKEKFTKDREANKLLKRKMKKEWKA